MCWYGTCSCGTCLCGVGWPSSARWRPDLEPAVQEPHQRPEPPQCPGPGWPRRRAGRTWPGAAADGLPRSGAGPRPSWPGCWPVLERSRPGQGMELSRRSPGLPHSGAEDGTCAVTELWLGRQTQLAIVPMIARRQQPPHHEFLPAARKSQLWSRKCWGARSAMGAHCHLSGGRLHRSWHLPQRYQTDVAKDRITGQQTCAGPVRFAQVSEPVLPDHRVTTQLT